MANPVNNRIRLALTVAVSTVVSACKPEEDETTICHFPGSSDAYEVITVGNSELEDHFYDHGDLCYSAADDACYEPDFDGWEAGDEFCPS